MKKTLCARTEVKAFGRTGEIEIFYPDMTSYDVLARVVLDLAVKECGRLDHMLSSDDPESEVSRLNQTAGKEYVRVGRETMYLLHQEKKASLESDDERAAQFEHLYLMPQGQFGCGYDEEIADDLYGGYIGGIAMIATEDAAVSIDEAAARYAVKQIADILREYGVRNARIRIGEAGISSSEYVQMFRQRGMRRKGGAEVYGTAGA